MKLEGIFIPKEILEDNRLNALDKIILMRIDILENDEIGCTSTNEELAKLCNCTCTTISTTIKKLVKLNYIEIINYDGKNRILTSKVENNYKKALKILKEDASKKIKQRKEYEKMKQRLEEFTDNIELKSELYRYLEFRRSSGRFTFEQFNAILHDLAVKFQEECEEYESNSVIEYITEEVHHSLICGYKRIYFR